MTRQHSPGYWERRMIRKDPHMPVLRIVRDTARSSFVWCPYCRLEHIHGREDDAPGAGSHKGAHCMNPDSPLRKTGYVIMRDPIPEWGL